MKIIGYGKYVPKESLTNEKLEKMVETTDEWISTRTGIKNRYIAKEETLKEMSTNAAIEAIKNAKLDVEDIDMIISATSSGDYIIPSLSCQVHNGLGMKKDVMSFDLAAACSGFIYGLDIASKYLSDEVKNILIIGAEKLSRVVDYEDRNTCILFGDGAAACIVTNDNRKNYCSIMKASGTKSDALTLKGLNDGASFIEMNGKEIFMFASKVIPEITTKVLDKANVKLEDIKYIVPHQANSRIIDAAAKKLDVSIDKFFINLDNFGNTSAASIPLALCEMNEKNLINDGDKIVLAGFGGGLTWGGMYIEL